MKQKKDTRFLLTSFFEEQEQTKHTYKSFQNQIENNGCFIVKVDTDTVKIYNAELAVIITSQDLPAQNMDTQKETTLNGWEYLNTYIEAYKEGEQHFETEFKVSPNTLYGANAEQYVRDIHLNFFHVQHTGINKGWGYVKKKYPIILTHKAVKEFGYYSGIVNKVEEQVKKYPRLFATFDKCEHNLQPQQAETNPEQVKTIVKETNTEIINTFCKSMPLNIPKEHFKVFIDTNSKNKKTFLTTEQYNSFIERAFCGNTDMPKQKFNQAPKGEKLLIQSVFYEFYNTNCFEYFHTMQCQENFIKLLTDNFEGWDFKNVQENFTPKTKKRL